MSELAIEALPIAGLCLIRPRVHRDARGFFLESWSAGRHRDAGIDASFVQDNHSRSALGTLRGLHYQRFDGGLSGQAKLVRVGRGRIFDVAVDLRRDSPTFGRWHGVELDDEQHAQLYIPAGCAHGFAVLSDVADVLYKVSTPYDAATERGVAWDDPALAIPWPVAQPILSERDRTNPTFAEATGA